MKKVFIFTVIILTLFSLCACSKSPEALPKAIAAVVYPGEERFNDHEARRDKRKQNPVEDGFLASLSDFSYLTASAVLSDSEGNANYSPVSLYFALAVAATGAGGQTQRQLFELLGVSSSAELSGQCSNLFRLLYTDNEISKLTLANSLWLDVDTTFNDAFAKNAAGHFYASSFPADFADKATGEAMGKWIAENTAGTLSPELTTDPRQILSIISTVYFYDEWINRFDRDNTAAGVFRTDSGDVDSEYMNGMIFGGFSRCGSFSRASLGFKDGGQMVFILPEDGVSVRELIGSAEAFGSLFAGEDTGFAEVKWQVPKFDFECNYDKLPETLISLGVTDAFRPDADFSGITDSAAYISEIIQQTRISIDEKGVEAAAFTQLNFLGAGYPEDEFEMILDRPFIYGIKAQNGTLLFVGICENPSR